MKKKKRKYTISEKRLARDAKQADWSKRMQIVNLYEKEGLTFKEIGEKLGSTKANVHKLYQKAKKQLPDQIGS